MLGRLDTQSAVDSTGVHRWTFIDKTVSRTHAELSLNDEGEVELTHRSATNETFVNGQSVSIEALESGQVLQLGRTKLIVQERNAEAAVSEPVMDRSGTVDRQLSDPDFEKALEKAREQESPEPTVINLDVGLTFHLPSSDDVEAIVEMMKDYALEIGQVFSDRFARRTVDTLRTVASAGRVWMVRLDSQNIGYLIMTFGFDTQTAEREAFLDNLYLKQEFRGQGNGIKSVDFAKYQGRKFGATIFRMRPRASDQSAQNFCARCGFEELSVSVWASTTQ